MPILFYSTGIDAWKTISEIQQILSRHGATHCSIKNEGSFPVALTFSIDYKGQPLNFLLPCNHMGVLSVFKKDKKVPRSSQNETQALRTAWKIIKGWVESQMALVESEQAKPEVIFLPYMVNQNGDTLSKIILEGNGMKLLNQ